MEAVILAGGFGKRLGTLISDVPKPMAPIGGRPFLEILLKRLSEKKFQHIVLSLGYRAEQISSYFKSEYAGMKLDYVVEQEPLGTGGALRLAFSECRGDPVFIFNGDTFIDLEIDDMLQTWKQFGCHPIIVARRVEDTSRFGVMKTDGNLVTSFCEKGRSGSGLINAGCYLFSKNILDKYELLTAFSLETDFLVSEVHKTSFVFFETQGLFIDIGIPEDYRTAQSLLLPYF